MKVEPDPYKKRLLPAPIICLRRNGKDRWFFWNLKTGFLIEM